jgi:hypothetical protein
VVQHHQAAEGEGEEHQLRQVVEEVEEVLPVLLNQALGEGAAWMVHGLEEVAAAEGHWVLRSQVGEAEVVEEDWEKMCAGQGEARWVPEVEGEEQLERMVQLVRAGPLALVEVEGVERLGPGLEEEGVHGSHSWEEA